MKTPEEIKKGILCDGPCNDCPYKGRIMSDGGCGQAVIDDTLDLIQQLEREKEALLKALKDADVYGECENCKYRKDADINCAEANYYCSACDADCKCKDCLNGSNWEWIGVREEANADG